MPDLLGRRDLFEIENARNLTRDELVATFVPTRTFWRLLSAKNHIVLGSRGSGKTALTKMLAHDHLSRLDNERARDVLKNREFIGIHLPTSVEWVGGLRNKTWHSEADAERFFQWRLNLAACRAFLTTLRSCVDAYHPTPGERAHAERRAVRRISTAWSNDARQCDTIRTLENYLDDVEYSRQQAEVGSHLAAQSSPRLAAGPFDVELFAPLRRGIKLAARELSLPETSAWLLCLDEAEFLEPFHHRILNSHLRTSSGSLFFKITTTPYGHHSLETNVGASLSEGHDFEYVYIDQEATLSVQAQDDLRREFASQVFARRANVSGRKYRGVTLKRLLGASDLLDAKPSAWRNDPSLFELLRQHVDTVTAQRAGRLEGSEQFMDQVARKLHGALLLREAVRRTKGRDELEVYSGFKMAVRCADGNPRRMIRLFNAFLRDARWRKNRLGKRRIEPLPKNQQTRILVAFSTTTLERVQSEPGCGPELYALLLLIGEFMRSALHDRPLSTDQISSVKVDTTVGRGVWRLVKRAVDLGLLFPNVGSRNPDQIPTTEGEFHFAYILAPHFRLLPRRGKARNVRSMIANFRPESDDMSAQPRLQFEA